MNIKRAIETIYQISTEYCQQDLKNVKINMWDLKRILQALDEPICICMDKGSVYEYSSKCHVHGVGLEPIVPIKTPFDDYHYCQGWDAAIREHAQPKENEIKQLKAHLANAKQSNESLSNQAARLHGDLAIANGLVKNLEEQLASRKVWGVPVVTKLEYNTLRTKFENYIMTVENIVKKYEQELRKEINHGTY